MFSRTKFFLLLVSITTVYGFYLITADDDEFKYPETAGFPTNDDFDEEGFIPKLAIPQTIAVLDDDDLDYMDRVNRLQHALKVKRSIVSQADGYSQNIRPVDLDGMKLVRAPIIELLDEDDYFEPIARRVSRMDAPAPFSYIVLN